jgi:hypothetical protein
MAHQTAVNSKDLKAKSIHHLGKLNLAKIYWANEYQQKWNSIVAGYAALKQ